MAVEAGILLIGEHQIVERAVDNNLFRLGDVQQFGIELTQSLLFGGQLSTVLTAVVDPMAQALHTPVVEDGGASIPSTESLLIHASFPQFLTGIDHHGVRIELCRNDEVRYTCLRLTGKEVGGHTLLVVVL